MNRFANRMRATIGAATVLAFASPLAAQGRPAPLRRAMQGGVAGYLAAHPDALGLSDAQTARLRRVAQWLEQNDSTLRGQMRAAFGGKRPVDLTAEQRYQAMKQIQPLADQMTANRRAAMDSVHTILTPDQFQRLGERAMAMRAWGRGFARGFARGRLGFRARPWGRGDGFWGGMRWPG